MDELDDEKEDQFSALQDKFHRDQSDNKDGQHRFSAIFDRKVAECVDIVEMVANLKYINYLLMGMTNLFAENLLLLDSQTNDQEYY